MSYLILSADFNQAEGVHTSTKIPPSELRIEDAEKPPRHKHSRSQPEIQPFEFSQPQHQYYYHPPPHPGYGAPFYHQHHQPPFSPSLTNIYQPPIPSSDPFDPDDVPTLYPRVDEWLTELDSTARGADGQNWAQYAGALNINGYTRIIQIAEDGKDTGGAKELADLCSMPVGIAKLLIKYATTDCDKITKNEKKIRKGAK
jgi:hypothetical protein